MPIIPESLTELASQENRTEFVKDIVADFGSHSLLSLGVWLTGHKLEETELAALLTVVIMFVCIYRTHRKLVKRKVVKGKIPVTVWIGAHRF